MKHKYLKLILTLISLLLAGVFAFASSDDANVYFNAGTEKYLQGNFTESIENLEKAQALDPSNKKIKEFMVKILLEAATQNHLTRNYRQAFIYIEKAKKMDPDNPKVTEMYQLTNELLHPGQERVSRSGNTPRIQQDEDLRRSESISKEAFEALQKKTAAAVRQNTETLKEEIQLAKNRGPAKGLLSIEVTNIKEWHIWLLIGSIVFISFITVILFILLIFKMREASNYKMQFIGIEEDLKSAVENRNECMIELEKTKERVKYEHQALENMQSELKEKDKKDTVRQKMELNIKEKEIEEKVRSEMAEKINVSGGPKEHFIHHQQERFMKYISDTSTPAEAETDPVLASARERIALMAQNLYEYAPAAAVDFITKMARNDNPSIRTNIVQALSNIAKPETFELLFGLYDDADPHVKREVLRNLKILNQKIAAGSVDFGAQITEKIKLLISKEKDRGEWIF